MLSGKVAVITGASGGIGSACTELFCKNHASVYALVRNTGGQFALFTEKLKNDGADITAVECDLLDESSIRSAVKEITSHTKTIDILVNNAGAVDENTSFQMTSADKIRNLFEINFFGPSVLTQYISRIMSRRKCGSIVNISSVAALDGRPGQYEYAASKSAVIGASKELAIELGKSGIRVNAVAPGITNTKMASHISGELYNETIENTILKRPAEPMEIANAVLFLASDMSGYITGQVLRVDGGKI